MTTEFFDTEVHFQQVIGSKNALVELAQAFALSRRAGVCCWQFALEVHELRQKGLSLTELRWLVQQGLLKHAFEITHGSSPERTFQEHQTLKFDERSCFTVDPICADAFLAAIVKKATTPSCVDHEPRQKPYWNGLRHELLFLGQVIKRFKVPSPNQEMVLRVFEEENWPLRIDDPLPAIADQLPRQRLNDTIRSLNRNQKITALHFSGDGTGEGILWEPVIPIPGSRHYAVQDSCSLAK